MRSGAQSVALLLLGFAVGVGTLLATGYQPFGVVPQAVQGYVVGVDEDGVVDLSDSPDGDLFGSYRVSGAPYENAAGSWEMTPDPSRLPFCVSQADPGQVLEVGVIHVRASADAPGGEDVVWARCLD